jgi:hypothetical protein
VPRVGFTGELFAPVRARVFVATDQAFRRGWIDHPAAGQGFRVRGAMWPVFDGDGDGDGDEGARVALAAEHLWWEGNLVMLLIRDVDLSDPSGSGVRRPLQRASLLLQTFFSFFLIKGTETD